MNPYTTNCGNGVLLNGQQIVNAPSDAYQPSTPAFEQQWVKYLIQKYGPANGGGVRMRSMDNEPEWWYGVHLDIYQTMATYDDMMARDKRAEVTDEEAVPTRSNRVTVTLPVET